MAIGTAGFTAAMSVVALEDRGLEPADGPVLVTGASGGVGGTALAILADRGYEVWAATGKADEAERLTGLGAAGILTRDEVTAEGRPLEAERWAGAVDAVGGGDAAVRPAHAQDGRAPSRPAATPAARSSTRPSSRSSCAASRCSGWTRSRCRSPAAAAVGPAGDGPAAAGARRHVTEVDLDGLDGRSTGSWPGRRAAAGSCGSTGD